MATGDARARQERRDARWVVLDLLWERVLRFFGFAELPYGWFERLTRRDLPLALALLRGVRRATPWLLAPVAFAGVGGLVLLGTLPPTHTMLRNDLEHAGLPDGRDSITSREGNFLCFRGCPSVTKVVIVEGTVSDWSNRWGQLLVESGAPMGDWTEDGEGGVTAKLARYRRRFFATVGNGPVTVGSRGGPRRIDVQPGHVALVLRIEATRERTPSV